MGSAVYALLVRILLPRRVRRRLGADLMACHAEVMGRATGPLGRTRRWIREVGDLVAAAWRVRTGGSSDTGRAPTPDPGPASLGAGRSWTAPLIDDLVHALRSLVRSPGSTAFVVLVMGGGLGAATAVYSAVRHTVLHPLPYDAADRMVSLWRTVGEGSLISATPEQAELWGSQTDLVEGLIRLGPATVALTGRGEPVALYSTRISLDYFRTLGVQPTLGRSFVPEEMVDGGPKSLLIDHGTWVRRFGADPGVLGTTLTLDGEPWTVVGVGPRVAPLPTGIPLDPAFYLPLRPGDRASNSVVVLRPEVTLEEYQERLDTLVVRVAAEEGTPVRYGAAPQSARSMAGGRLRRSLTTLSAAVAILLLIACLNVSALLVNRADRRRHETAVRMALGAGRHRLVRQHLLESLVLAGAACLVGLALGLVGVELIRAFRPDQLSLLDRVRLDRPVALFAAAAALATGVVFGLLPALQSGSSRALAALRGGARGARDDRGAQRARWLLVVGEVALSFALLVGSALMVRTMLSIQSMDVGFQPEGVVAVEVSLPEWRYPTDADRAVAWQEMTAAVERMATVAGASAAVGVPTRPNVYFGTLEVEGRLLDEAEASQPFFGFGVTHGFFDLMAQSVLAGRTFTEAEIRDDADVYVLGESTAAALWPDGDAVGRRMRIGEGEWKTVVGVVADVPITSMDMTDRADRQLYAPATQGSWLIVRTRGEIVDAMPGIRAALRSAAPDAPIEMTDMVTVLGGSVATQRFTMQLLSVLGALAVGLAGLGLYGVVSQTVGRRTREIGIRMSLGARTGEVVWLMLRSGGVAVLVGIVAGTALSLAGGRVIESQLVVVEPGDPASFGLAAGVLVLAAGLATILPARRAARVDPVRAMTAE